MERQIPLVMRMLSTASQGQRDSLHELGLQNGFDYDIPSRFDPTATSKKQLQEEIDDLVFFAEAANRIHMDRCEEVARKALAHMIHSFYCCYDEMPKVHRSYCGEDLSEELTELIQAECRSIDILKQFEGSKRQRQPPSEPNQKQECDRESDKGSEYLPSESASSSDEETDDDAASKRPQASPSSPSLKSLKRKESSAGSPPASSSSPSSKKPKQKESSASSPPASSSSPSSKKPKQKESSASAPPESSSSPKTRSHHQKKACPVPKCSFYGNDLRRHLLTHVKKREIADDAVDKLLSIVRAGAKSRGKKQARKGKVPVKGRLKKWCPVPDCNQVVQDMARHLENPSTHDFPRGSKVHIRYLKMATAYTGLGELEDQLVPPPPAIVEVQPKHDSSPVFAAAARVSPSTPQSAILDDATSTTLSAVATALSAVSAAASGTSSATASVAASASLSAVTAPGTNSATASGAASAFPSAVAHPSPSAAAASPASAAASVPSTSLSATPATDQVDNADAADSKPESDTESEQSEENCSEQGEEAEVSSVQYFTAAHPSTIRHQWLVLFYEFLTRPTAGDKKRSIRLQHASQMRLLLETIDPKGDDILHLLDDQGDAVWKKWVKPHLTNGTKKPGTIISYLTSFEKFLTFVTHERFNKAAPPIHPDDLKRFSTLQKDIKGWRSCVDSQSYHLKNQRMVNETEGLLTLEELAKIKNSHAYNNAQKLIIQAGQGRELSAKEFVDVRDFLLTKFSLDTGTRPGPLNNATLMEYTSGKVKDGCKVMLVAKHKRAKDGPAICPMLADQYKFMEIYVRRIRPDFAAPEEDALFVKQDGRGFREGTIGRRLSQFIEKCGVNLGSRMAFVDMRKLITTEMLERCSPEERAILRRVLAHSKKTSRQWYARPDLTNTGIKAVNIIQRLLDVKEKKKEEAAASSSKKQGPPASETSLTSRQLSSPVSPRQTASKEKSSPAATPASTDEQGPPVSPRQTASKEKSSPAATPASTDEQGPPVSPRQTAPKAKTLPAARPASTDEQGPPASPQQTAPKAKTSPAAPPVSTNQQSPQPTSKGQNPTPSTSKAKRLATPPSGETPSEPCAKSSKASTMVSGIVPPSPEAKALSDKQKRNIRTAFAKSIQASATVTMNEVQNTLRNVPSLYVLSFSKKRVKQVVNYLNYVINTEAATPTPPEAEVSQETKVSNWLDDFDDPSSRSTAPKRNEWDPEDTELLRKAFREHSELPTTKDIRRIIRSNPKLQDILDVGGWDRVYNKLKNIYRKKK